MTGQTGSLSYASPGFRWAICGRGAALYLPGFMLSMAVTAFFLWLGIWYFRRTEKTFADVI